MPTCQICHSKFRSISNTHLRLHGWKFNAYIKKFGRDGVGFIRLISDLSKSDPRYIRWRKNLKKRPPPWNKGHTKDSHHGVAKISRTFQIKKIDNFSKWRKWAQRRGLIKSKWPSLKRDGDLAEFIGVILGDGNITKFPRTECLTLASNSNNRGFIGRYASFFKKFFDKDPYIEPPRAHNCTRIRVYQKHISKRLGVPIGDRGKILNKILGTLFARIV